MMHRNRRKWHDRQRAHAGQEPAQELFRLGDCGEVSGVAHVTAMAWFLQTAAARRRIMGPNELAWLDAALGLLAEAGVPARQRHAAFPVAIGHGRSNAEFMAGVDRGPSGGQWVQVVTEMLGKRRERYPALMTTLDSGALSQPPEKH